MEQADEFEPYQRTAQALYKELIAPIRPELERRHITTLVFVPDGALREIPMAVLYDGERHLIEDFAIAPSGTKTSVVMCRRSSSGRIGAISSL